MAISSPLRPRPSAPGDPILPWLSLIRSTLDDYRRNPAKYGEVFTKMLEECIRKFSNDEKYRNDARFLRVWILYGDAIQDFRKAFGVMEERGICLGFSMLYEAYAMFLVAKGELLEAHRVLRIGIDRKAEPIDELKQMQQTFLDHMDDLAQNAVGDIKSNTTESFAKKTDYVDPWSPSTINELLQKLDSQIRKYNGYHKSNKPYSGKVSLQSLKNSSRNKILELGGIKYQIKGCSGVGGLAQVYKAYIDSSPDDVVALKIQKPSFPWEFYMYRLLDKRLPEIERPSFGIAHKVHVFSDLSVLVCNYLSHGTLQDAINSHLIMQKVMEEVLCIFYTIEMLRMLEVLHTAGIIHGDFKPDNLLVRYSREELTTDKESFSSRSGPWRDQGLCLVDWGRGIDLNLFPPNTEFMGDCRTSGFRCVEMKENRPWTFQVDAYCLCVNVHMMLHGSYMIVEKKTNAGGSCQYQPKTTLKRYWNTELWSRLFSSLLNMPSSDSDVSILKSLRISFEDYLYKTPQLIKDLKLLLVKQKASLCSA